MIPPPPSKITISRPQLEAQIRQCEAELGIWKMHLEAHLERGVQEPRHIAAFCMSQGYTPANPYLASITQDYEAKANLIRLTIAKMEGQLMSMKAMLAEGDKKVAVPGTF
jgi:hypothetical protein